MNRNRLSCAAGIPCAAAITGLVAVDQFTKAAAHRALTEGPKILLPGVLPVPGSESA